MDPTIFNKLQQLLTLHRNSTKYRIRTDYKKLLDELDTLVKGVQLQQSSPSSYTAQERPISASCPTPTPPSCSPVRENVISPILPSSQSLPEEWQKTGNSISKKTQQTSSICNASNSDEAWQTPHKKRRKPALKETLPPAKPTFRSRPTTEALLIVNRKNRLCSETYSAALKKVRRVVDAKLLDVEIKAARFINKGGYILECNRNAGLLYEHILPILQEDFHVHHLVPQADLIIQDLDPTVDVDDIRIALKRQNVTADKIKIRQLPRGKACAYLQIPKSSTNLLLAAEKIQIGWTRARIRLREPTTRCPRCLNVGHLLSQCRSKTDFRNQCFRCSQVGHRAVSCTLDPHCNWCNHKGKDANHSFSVACRSS